MSDLITLSQWQLDELYFQSLFEREVKASRIMRPRRGALVVVHTPDELPGGPGHWTGGRFDDINAAFDFMKGLGAGRSYSYMVQNPDGSYSIWIVDKQK